MPLMVLKVFQLLLCFSADTIIPIKYIFDWNYRNFNDAFNKGVESMGNNRLLKLFNLIAALMTTLLIITLSITYSLTSEE